jgi:hypothetical protein
MKKLISVLFATVLMAAGLVVATGSSASANCTPSQYSGCVTTKTKVSAPNSVDKGSKATVCAKVKAVNSNATPTGTVVFTVTRNKGNYFFKKSVSYSGAKVCVSTSKLKKKGGYSVSAKYKSPDGSVFLNSEGSDGFDVS